jgi:hypothetical protein
MTDYLLAQGLACDAGQEVFDDNAGAESRHLQGPLLLLS